MSDLPSGPGPRWPAVSGGDSAPGCRLTARLPCLPRQEMDSLQRQMEAHAVTVHQSLSSWTQGDPASPSRLGDHANPRGDTEQHGQSGATREHFGAVTAEHPHPECL